jgi:DNA-binding PadR family transcriptional regulator
LYGAIARMLDAELIAEVAGSTGDRRRSYRITRAGRALVQREAERLARAANFARAKRLIGPMDFRP